MREFNSPNYFLQKNQKNDKVIRMGVITDSDESTESRSAKNPSLTRRVSYPWIVNSGILIIIIILIILNIILILILY